MKKFFSDLSSSSIITALIINLVGYTSSAFVVFQGAAQFGLPATEAAHWIGILCIAMGLLTIYYSLSLKIPVMFAWSTAGAALLASSTDLHSLPSAVGAFLFSAFLIFLSGITGIFEKLMNKIPVSLCAAMLTGILLKLVLGAVLTAQTNLVLTLLMMASYILSRKFFPRFAVINATLVGVIFYFTSSDIIILSSKSVFLELVFTTPAWDVRSILSLGLPLFLVTMTSQNLTGISTLRTHHYGDIPISNIITVSGLCNMIIAPFGGFSLNLAAVTAAMSMGHEAHVDKDKRYTAAVCAGFFYVIAGLFSGAIGHFLSHLPSNLIQCITGLALMSTVTNGLWQTLKNSKEQEAAIFTFFVTASGVTFLGIGSAFWGILVGALVHSLFSKMLVLDTK